MTNVTNTNFRIMRKFLLIIVCALSITSCSDNDPEILSVMINVKCDNKIASPSLVRLYEYETARDFDDSYMSTMEYGDSQVLRDKSGNELTPAYTSDTFSGINIFEDIKTGVYLAVILYKPDGFTWPMFYFYGYKVINVDEDNNALLHNICFSYSEYDRGKFIEF